MRLRLRLAISDRGAFNPAVLFTNGEEGAWYDPSDLSTLWQDSARTTPVTGDGDPVGCIDDKSGNGLHAKQTVAVARPTYKTSGGLHWLEYDGVDDGLITGNLDLTGTSAVTVVAGARLASTPGDAAFLVSFADTGFSRFDLLANTTPDMLWQFVGATTLNTIFGAPSVGSDVVWTGLADISTPTGTLRKNGAVVDTDTTATGGGSFRNEPLAIGRDAGTPRRYWPGRFYGAIVIDRVLSAGEIARAEAWMARKSGVTL